MNSDNLPRESSAARLKTMLRMPGVTILDADRLEVRDDSMFDEALRKAKAAGEIMGRSIGHVQGRSLILTVLPADGSALSCRYPGERASCRFPLCDCPVPRPEAPAPSHRWEPGGMYCSCGQDVVTCQGCGKSACGDVASWVEGRGNVGPCCAALFGLGHAGTP